MSELTESIPDALRTAILSDFSGKRGTRLTPAEVTFAARRWNLTQDCIRALWVEGQVDFARIRQATAIKGAFIQHAVLDALAEDVQDPKKLNEVPMEKKATMAKQLGDMSINALNGTTASSGTTINIAELSALIVQREARGPYVPVSRALMEP
jgi:hypothetical protein